METKFDDYERVEKAAKELIRAVVWEHLDIGCGEEETFLDNVIEECAKMYAENLIVNASLAARCTYLQEYWKRETLK